MKFSVCPLYGALGGDLIGSVFKKHNTKGKDFQLFSSRSKITDDSVLTVATADALIHHYGYVEAYQKWGKRYPAAGYGGSFRRWLAVENPQPYNPKGGLMVTRSL